jgi:hypothetical protein
LELKVKLDLVGIDGNAFAVMGAFKKAAQRQGMPKEEIDQILAEAKSGDYNYLLATIIDHTESEDEFDD